MLHLRQVAGCVPTWGACVAPPGTMKARSQEGGFLVRSRCNVLSHGSGVHGVTVVSIIRCFLLSSVNWQILLLARLLEVEAFVWKQRCIAA